MSDGVCTASVASDTHRPAYDWESSGAVVGAETKMIASFAMPLAAMLAVA